MSCIPERWPQSLANVVSFTPTGEIRWMRWWDPMVELDPSVPDSGRRICQVVTESHLAAVYRETSTNKWYLSTLNYEDGSPGVTHVDLGITQAVGIAGIGATPLRTEIHVGVLDSSANTATVHGIDSIGTVTTGVSSPESDGGTMWTKPLMMPNGEMVTFVSDGNFHTVVVTDSSGEVWRDTDFAEIFGGEGGVFGTAVEDSTSSGVMYFIIASGGDDVNPLWEWWKLDSLANTVTRTGGEGASFTTPASPVPLEHGQVAKGSAGKVWIFEDASNCERIELRDIADDAGDVLLTIVPSDFDTGGNTFSILNATNGLGTRFDRPGRMIDASGRFYVSAQGSGIVRLLGCSEDNTRRHSPVLDTVQISSPVVVVSDGVAVFPYSGDRTVSPIDDENGNEIEVDRMISAWEYGATALDFEWGWNETEQSALQPVAWVDDDGSVILFAYPQPRELSNPSFFTRYVIRVGTNATRMLDVNRV